jgi:hypothetical protein
MPPWLNVQLDIGLESIHEEVRGPLLGYRDHNVPFLLFNQNPKGLTLKIRWVIDGAIFDSSSNRIQSLL